MLRAVIDARETAIEDVRFGTGIELRLPSKWNGRFLFQGGGGLNGVLMPATGPVAGSASALERGFAVVSSDGGHRGRSPMDARFALDQQGRLDFAYQAVARATREAKHLVAGFYGSDPQHSYFMGCSTGGREAMLAAQRLPLEFDGVVAGNPAFNLTRIVVNQIWSHQAVARAAPKDAQGRPQLHAALTDEQLRGVSAAVLKQCDGLDNLADGLINDFRACRFDPESATCGAESASAPGQCLAPTQVRLLQDIFGGAQDSSGKSLYAPFPFDTGVTAPAWRSIHLGSPTSPPANAMQNFLV